MENYASEAQEQETLFEWADLQKQKYIELKLLYHIPNEGKRSFLTGAALKKQGLKSGVPDICLPVSNGTYGALYIEMKSKGGILSPAQKEWQIMLNAAGNKAVVCFGWEEAAKELVNYLKPRYIFKRLKDGEKL